MSWVAFAGGNAAEAAAAGAAWPGRSARRHPPVRDVHRTFFSSSFFSFCFVVARVFFSVSAAPIGSLFHDARANVCAVALHVVGSAHLQYWEDGARDGVVVSAARETSRCPRRVPLFTLNESLPVASQAAPR